MIQVLHTSRPGRRPLLLAVGLALSLAGGCSIKQIAVRQLGDALTGGGTTFASDNDPELIRAAVPFSLKLIETLLQESPRHAGLLLTATSGFVQYSFAFVQQEADRIEADDLAAAEALRDRARLLYLRARDYGLRGLEVALPGFPASLRAHPQTVVQRLQRKHVPLLYWTAAAWGAAISLSKDDPHLVGEQPLVETLIDRALALDEGFDRGAVHSFLIAYEMARQGAAGDAADRARHHFERAVALSQGRLAGPYVAYAESVMVQQQDAAQFKKLLDQALAINLDDLPDSRLVNVIMQQRARWLLSRRDELFLTPATR